MEKRWKLKFFRRLIFISIGFIIILGLIRNVGIESLRYSLSNADPIYIILGLLCFSCVMMAKIIRWSNLFVYANFFDSLKIFSIGAVVNETAPIGSGELTRGFVARTKFGISFSKTLAPALIERISDVTFLFALALMFILILFTGGSYNFILIFVILILTIVYLILFRPKYLDILNRKLIKFSKNRVGIIHKTTLTIFRFLKNFQRALLKFHERKTVILSTICLTIFAWTIESFGQYILVNGFGHGIDMNFFGFMALIGASWIIGTFSFLPGGLGVREFVFATLLQETQGIPFDDGFAIALTYRVLNYMLLSSFAFGSFVTLPKDIEKKKYSLKKQRVLRIRTDD